MGGLPWWLLKKKDIRLRERDPYFMERVRIFEREVGRQLAGLTIERGGPIIMVQVENEYGSYGVDKQYISEIRDILRESGFDKVTLFQCDWASNFTLNGLDDLVWTMNFGTGANIDEQFRRLKELRPNAPLMCSEFWSGWFDKWGAHHETRPADDMVAGIDQMLTKGISFSLYMTHGGTSFGHWAGANSPGFAPDVTSYDYDAPISESGLPTEKFWVLRRTMVRHAGGRQLPPVPKAPMGTVAVAPFGLDEFAPIRSGIDRSIRSRDVKTMEGLDMSWGTMIYETTLPAVSPNTTLNINDCDDFARVFVDGVCVGRVDRSRNERSILLPPSARGAKLMILVEAMGRINFGRSIKDHKGITQNVTLCCEVDGHEQTIDLKKWTISTVPDTYEAASGALAKGGSAANGEAGYYRGHFDLGKVGDTFINTESFGKGQAYVNGHAIGRFWSIGPQQTLYVPGCWLHKGRNELVVLDVIGPSGAPTVFGSTEPELNKLNVAASVRHNDPADRPDTGARKPVAEVAMNAGNGWQTIAFDKAATGRYLGLECLSTHDGQPLSIAELHLRSAEGNRISREPWRVKCADSENEKGNHNADKTFDLQESTYWQTQRNAEGPHLIMIDLGSEQTVSALDYLPRAEQGAPGSLKDCRIFVF